MTIRKAAVYAQMNAKGQAILADNVQAITVLC
jgi:hypothetical protein